MHVHLHMGLLAAVLATFAIWPNIRGSRSKESSGAHMRPQEVFAVTVLTACAASGSAVGKPVPSSIEGRSVVLVRRPDPGFVFATNGGVLAGAISALGPLHDMRPGHEMEDAGRQLTAEDKIDDPAVSLSAVLLSGLVDTYKLRLLSSTAVIVSDEKRLEDYRKQNQPDLIFEFYTEAWRTFYFLDFKHYDVWYYAKARLIDGRTGSVIHQAKCAHKPVKTSASPTLDELVAEHGVKLRAAVEAAKELCLATARQEFGVSVSSDASGK
jgi:hypothetical protein